MKYIFGQATSKLKSLKEQQHWFSKGTYNEQQKGKKQRRNGMARKFCL